MHVLVGGRPGERFILYLAGSIVGPVAAIFAPCESRGQETFAMKRLWFVPAVALMLSPLLAVRSDEPMAMREFRGKVMPIAEVLAKQGIKLDADAGPTSLALVTEDGKAYP